MKMKTGIWHLSVLLALALVSCSNDKSEPSAYGNFEAEEIMLSAEATGKIIDLSVREGDQIKIGQVLGMIDTVQLDLKRQQILASMGAVQSRVQDVQVQINVLERKKDNILREKSRIERLLRDSAATRKQYDDICGELDVVDKQIIANRSSLTTSNSAVVSEKNPLAIQVKQINDQIAKSYLLSPINATILVKYAFSGEFATIGKPILKIANLNEMTVKVFIDANQLAQIKLNQIVKVAIDYNNSLKYYEGRVYWISDKAEFTPKIVQTKNERANLVYAVKILVKNDGSIKIGMPGEVYF